MWVLWVSIFDKYFIDGWIIRKSGILPENNSSFNRGRPMFSSGSIKVAYDDEQPITNWNLTL